MKILKNRFKFLLVALSALVLPSNGYCYDNVYESQLRNSSDYYPFMGMALGLVCVLLVFAVIFYAISHKTKREKMHIELLVEMVRHGLLQLRNKLLTKA